ncbi:MAG: HD domain-containing protein [bacterium]
MSTITVEDVKRNQLVSGLIEAANEYLGAIGYTEHGFRHASLVSNVAQNILEHLMYREPLPKLAAIAGYMHDIGNVINRNDHGRASAMIAIRVMEELKCDPMEIAYVISAIGNHEEQTGEPINPVAAAMILADKSDVHQSRVRNPRMVEFDIHDRVNYAAERSFLKVEQVHKSISLELNINTQISQVMEYFEIFLDRMIMCRRAAQFLHCNFELIINDKKVV